MTHLQKITTRAKQIRKAHPKKIWTDCIKAAAKELKAGKQAPKKAAQKKRVAGLDKVVKRGNHTSVEYSKKPKAVAKKKLAQGKLFGIGGGVTAKINAELSSIARHEKAAQHAMDLVKQVVTKAEKAAHRKTNAYHKKAVSVHKTNMRNLKKLL